ncbi:glycosyltransferase family 4 protein [Bradyrhizobium valentinum]|uniref:Mannosyltransferase n=1 Tax=Bradyrhizobium valentinum TaxID=1518501 RepID=A0A0R3L5F6_9BRAD|nr:glycosyltransferase family 1 protein [Bradyrhizobium valentinum]KRR03145.1 mannosyltransferase [Bradyrhizobium valentinum]KRR14079.1 mannosyltransferase [Bradyrhizobium valentinum]
MTFRRLAINGKFLIAGPTGVHRVAEQLIRQLEGRVSEFAGLFEKSPMLIAPPNLHRRPLDAFEVERAGAFRGQLWEQLDLPRLARPDLLLNLCNLGPMASKAAITMIHDAQVFATPGSYSWAFAKWYRNVLPVLGSRHARILTVSEFSANELARFGVARRDHISVVPNGVDHLLAYDSRPEIVNRLALVPRKFVVGLANVQAHKNVGLLLKAFTASELADLKLVLVGAARREEFEALGNSVPPNVVFAGRISDGELRALLESALCVGFPSTTEGFGLPPLEGMILGCPAILAPCGALTEVAGEGALFAAPDDPRQWIPAIRRLVDDPSHWAGYSRAGRERAAFFTWKRAGGKLADIIREVAMVLLSKGH